MNQLLFVFQGYPVTVGAALGAGAGLLGLLLLALVAGLWRARRARRRDGEIAAERQRELEARIADLAQAGAELNGRLSGMAELLGSGQANLTRVISERLDNVGARMGAGIENAAQTTSVNLNALNERLVLIDAAQARLAGLTQEVVSLKDILANKQARGAFGQGRMEAIVRDGLPSEAYDFQYTLKNRNRPDCVIHLPGDERVMVIDAKFPLEAFTLFKDARSDEARKGGFC